MDLHVQLEAEKKVWESRDGLKHFMASVTRNRTDALNGLRVKKPWSEKCFNRDLIRIQMKYMNRFLINSFRVCLQKKEPIGTPRLMCPHYKLQVQNLGADLSLSDSMYLNTHSLGQVPSRHPLPYIENATLESKMSILAMRK